MHTSAMHDSAIALVIRNYRETATQRNAGEARVTSGPNLVPNVRNEVFLLLCLGLPGAANRSRAAPLAKGAPCVAKKMTLPTSSACGAYPVAVAIKA